ncbi:MAG: aspartate carbamoyltransferase [Candidatus Daviesbacteria bacterium]|nr:aspartate carbamoyltransferase [Candidatus Daviesbacteria bacterium]
MNFKGRDIIDINDFSKDELLFVLKTAKRFDPAFVKSDRSNYTIARGKIAALLFFEPSTRTEQSFRSAAQKIGMGLIGFNNPELTSIHKGESFADTIRIMMAYADVMIIRHPEPGSARKAANVADIPVINAGDGPNSHPTQTILDIYTILKVFGRLDNLKIAFVGDPLHYRTFHGQFSALSKFSGNKFYGVSPKGLEMPKEFRNSDYHDVVINMKNLDKTLAELKPDIVSVGRIPKEYIKGDSSKYNFQVSVNTMKGLPGHAIIMHPLPRVNELDPALDSHPNAIYFAQARNGLYVREALLALILGRIF